MRVLSSPCVGALMPRGELALQPVMTPAAVRTRTSPPCADRWTVMKFSERVHTRNGPALVKIRVVTSFESVSTWRQPTPCARVSLSDKAHRGRGRDDRRLSARRLRIAIDGRTGAGKTSFGHELAAALRKLGRATLRASLDDFKHPWPTPASAAMTA